MFRIAFIFNLIISIFINNSFVYSLGLSYIKPLYKQNIDKEISNYFIEYCKLKEKCEGKSEIEKHVSFALLFYKYKKYNKALDEINEAINLNPKYSKEVYLLGIAIAYKLEKYEIVEKYCFDIIELYPDSYNDIYFLRIEAMYILKKYEQVEKYCNEAIILNPNCSEQIYFLRIISCLFLKKYKKTIEYASESINYFFEQVSIFDIFKKNIENYKEECSEIAYYQKYLFDLYLYRSIAYKRIGLLDEYNADLKEAKQINLLKAEHYSNLLDESLEHKEHSKKHANGQLKGNKSKNRTKVIKNQQKTFELIKTDIFPLTKIKKYDPSLNINKKSNKNNWVFNQKNKKEKFYLKGEEYFNEKKYILAEAEFLKALKLKYKIKDVKNKLKYIYKAFLEESLLEKKYNEAVFQCKKLINICTNKKDKDIYLLKKIDVLLIIANSLEEKLIDEIESKIKSYKDILKDCNNKQKKIKKDIWKKLVRLTILLIEKYMEKEDLEELFKNIKQLENCISVLKKIYNKNGTIKINNKQKIIELYGCFLEKCLDKKDLTKAEYAFVKLEKYLNTSNMSLEKKSIIPKNINKSFYRFYYFKAELCLEKNEITQMLDYLNKALIPSFEENVLSDKNIILKVFNKIISKNIYLEKNKKIILEILNKLKSFNLDKTIKEKISKISEKLKENEILKVMSNIKDAGIIDFKEELRNIKDKYIKKDNKIKEDKLCREKYVEKAIKNFKIMIKQYRCIIDEIIKYYKNNEEEQKFNKIVKQIEEYYSQYRYYKYKEHELNYYIGRLYYKYAEQKEKNKKNINRKKEKKYNDNPRERNYEIIVNYKKARRYFKKYLEYGYDKKRIYEVLINTYKKLFKLECENKNQQSIKFYYERCNNYIKKYNNNKKNKDKKKKYLKKIENYFKEKEFIWDTFEKEKVQHLWKKERQCNYTEDIKEFLIDCWEYRYLMFCFCIDFSEKYRKDIHCQRIKAIEFFENGLCQYSEKRNYQEAIKLYFKAIDVGYSNYSILMNLGCAYERLKDYKTAKKYFIEVEKNKMKKSTIYFNLANIFLKLKKYNKAIEYFNKSEKYNSVSIKTYIRRGIAYKNIENYKKAEQDFLEALVLNKDNVDALYALGRLYITLERNIEAEEIFKTLEKADYPKATIYFELGYIYFFLGAPQKAIKYYKKAFKYEYNEPSIILSNMSYIYNSLEDYNKALICANHSIKKDPAFEGAYFNKAFALVSVGQIEESEQAIEEYLKFAKEKKIDEEISNALNKYEKLKKNA